MTSPSGSKIIMEGQFDTRYIGYYRIWVSMFLVITVVGILFIPFWLIFSLWYGPESIRRLSVRLTPTTLEIQKGVYFRKEITIPPEPHHRRPAPRWPPDALLRHPRPQGRDRRPVRQ